MILSESIVLCSVYVDALTVPMISRYGFRVHWLKKYEDCQKKKSVFLSTNWNTAQPMLIKEDFAVLKS